MKPNKEDTYNSRRSHSSEAGFSLVELMIVIAIIAMLASVVAINLIGNLEEAEVTTAKAEINTIKTALMSYRIVFKKFPTTGEGLEALIKNEKNRKFIDANSVPKDPWGNDYIYKLEGSRNYTITSYGADGVPGGEAQDADISSADLSND